MNTDYSPASPASGFLSPRDRIVQRISMHGVPKEYIVGLQQGLVAFVKNNKSQIQQLVSAIMPADADLAEVLLEVKTGSKEALESQTLRQHYQESMAWLQWLMFEGEPSSALKKLSKMSVGERGVCGAVWGRDDVAFRCQTCELDPTCAICVPCFQNGNHKDHDYSIIYTGGGCCDCGDETAWRREGFCSKHKGAEQIQPLSDEVARSVGPALDALLDCWKSKLLVAASDHAVEARIVANELTLLVVEMVLDFCKQSESLLSFVARTVTSCNGLLTTLVRAEGFLSDGVTKTLHELLLKLLGEPLFKYEFALVFVNYYPSPVGEAIRGTGDDTFKKFPLLCMFSVQIFTVPTLTPRLVKEINLLGTLLGCLGDIFLSCSEADGLLQVSKWVRLFETSLRVVEDIRFVMSNPVVAEYVTHERRDISRCWLRILSFVQGMNPLKRETGVHIEEENDHMHFPFIMCHSFANIHSSLVAGAFSTAGSECTYEKAFRDTYKQDTDDRCSQRHAKVGRLSQVSSVCNSAPQSSESVSEDSLVNPGGDRQLLFPPSVSCLVFECLRALDSWLRANNMSGASSVSAPGSSSVFHSNFPALKKALSKFSKRLYDNTSAAGRHRSYSGFAGQCTSIDTFDSLAASSGSQVQHGTRRDTEPMDAGDFDSDDCHDHTEYNFNVMEVEPASGSEFCVLSLSNWPSIAYDVSCQEISVHIPIHGLLSLILKEALRKCYGESSTEDLACVDFGSPLPSSHDKFFEQILKGSHPSGFSAFMMEHPLQIRVFCSQVHAGMWRKNGDAPILSWELYRSCRSIRGPGHELELHLFLLQLCAALAPADLYVQRIVERFGLLSYLSLNLERPSEYEPILVQEMLTFIIQLVKERRFCGLSVSENLQRELIFKLATGDATRSQLVKSLPKDLSKSDQLQEILDKIAQYSTPSGMNQGKYSLRLPYWKDLDLYHPRWTPRDLQAAEERYSRFCGVSALNAQLPKWTKVYQPLCGIARIATCKMVLQVIRAVIFYSVFTDKSAESRAPVGVLITALHLLSLALNICLVHRKSGHLSSQEGESIPLLAFAGEEIGIGKQNEIGQQSLLSLLVLLMRMHKRENADSFADAGNFNLSLLVENLLKMFAELDSRCMTKLLQFSPEIINYQTGDTGSLSSVPYAERRKAKARERQAAVLAKMRAEQSKFLASFKRTADNGSDESTFGKDHESDAAAKESEFVRDICSLCHDPYSKTPLSFLVLLQKSRLVSFVDRGPPSWDQGWQSDQKEILSTGSKVIDSTIVKATSREASFPQFGQMVQDAVNEFACHGRPAEVIGFIDYLKKHFPASRNIHFSTKSSERKEKTLFSLESFEDDMFSAIHKEMSTYHDSSTQRDTKAVSYLGNTTETISDALLLGKYLAALARESTDYTAENGGSTVKSAAGIPPYYGFGPLDCDGIHISSCGHAVHQGCLDRYLSSLKDRYTRRIVFEGGHIVDPDQGEFLCPVCRRLGNSTLPAVTGDSHKLWEQPADPSSCSPHCVDSFSTMEEETNTFRLQDALSLLRSAASVVSKIETFKELPIQRLRRIRPNLVPVFRLLSGMYFPGKQDAFCRSGRVSPSIIMWDTLKYSLVSTEIAARCGRTSMTLNKGLEPLYDELKSSGGFVLPLLLRIVQGTRSKSLLDVLLRIRAVQLFAASVCCNSISGEHNEETFREEGKIARIFKCMDADIIFTDKHFWDLASDPVLARDPFSTLMWVFFCLPYPFLSSRESFLSLVHMFYAVSITQGIITYCAKRRCNISELGLHDCLVTDVARLTGESSIAHQYFVSNYVDPSCHIKDVIHSLSLPYLRRCALLWKLLKPSTPAPIYGRAYAVERSIYAGDGLETSCSGQEVDEVSELEHMFRIPPLDALLKDEVLRFLAQRWLHHFHEKFEHSSIQRPLHSTPAVQFRLMHLPLVYQDLVQRYIKPQCPNCHAVLEEAALCLLCGRLCSPSWKPCCRESLCQDHATSCAAGTGVFLLIRKTTILLQRNARQAPWPSPYLDAFGEEDVEMRRGKPLFLNEERYAALTYMVASHGLDHSSKVLRQTTIGTFFMV